MTLIRRTTPFGELLSLRQAMDRLMEDSFIRPRAGLTADEHPLALDFYTTPDSLVVEAALPGVKPDDVEVSLLGDQLTINATSNDERSNDENGTAYREIRRGTFTRTVTLPAGVDAERASASFENGLLRLSIPRVAEAKPRKIQISAVHDGAAAKTDADKGGTEDGGAESTVAPEPTQDQS